MCRKRCCRVSKRMASCDTGLSIGQGLGRTSNYLWAKAAQGIGECCATKESRGAASIVSILSTRH